MDTPTLRILDTLSSNMGDIMSINRLTERIQETYGTAYYANIYLKLHALKDDGLLTLNQMGRSFSAKLNFQNYLIVDALAEMEIEKKRNFLSKRSNILLFQSEMEKAFRNTCEIKSIGATNPEKTIKLNRIELFFLLEDTTNYPNQTVNIFTEMQKLQIKHNLKIDCLILNKTDFQELTTTNEINPAREALGEKILLLGPQAFWNQIKEIAERTEIKSIRAETKLANIAEADLIYNLARFGYTEFGRHITPGKKICVEYIATALLLQNDARLQGAAPIILAKNNFKSNVLAFLSGKFGIGKELLSMLKILGDVKPKQEISQTIDLLSTFTKEEISADRDAIMQKMRLYNVL